MRIEPAGREKRSLLAAAPSSIAFRELDRSGTSFEVAGKRLGVDVILVSRLGSYLFPLQQ
jgi:hypothetical protein